MFYSTLTLRFDPVRGGFDDQPLDEFSRSRELLSVKDHFFEQGGLPHLLLCISWRMPPAGSARKPKPEEDWKALLTTPEQHDSFDRLRRWRNETAKQEGKPAYAIFTNRQIAGHRRGSGSDHPLHSSSATWRLNCCGSGRNCSPTRGGRVNTHLSPSTIPRSG